LPASKDFTFADRQSTAALAKQALLEKFKKRPAEDDPAEMERRAERARIAEARDARIAEKEAQRKAEADRIAAIKQQAEDERLAAEAAIEAERLAAEQAIADEKAARDEAKSALIKRVVLDEAALKAARDARYASRKSRVGRG
jgi:uncharacterized FlgJ-related protein